MEFHPISDLLLINWYKYRFECEGFKSLLVTLGIGWESQGRFADYLAWPGQIHFYPIRSFIRPSSINIPCSFFWTDIPSFFQILSGFRAPNWDYRIKSLYFQKTKNFTKTIKRHPEIRCKSFFGSDGFALCARFDKPFRSCVGFLEDPFPSAQIHGRGKCGTIKFLWLRILKKNWMTDQHVRYFIWNLNVEDPDLWIGRQKSIVSVITHSMEKSIGVADLG